MPIHVTARPREVEMKPDPCCEAAARLAAFSDALLAWVRQASITELRINQAKLRLLEGYIAERNGSPAAHRDRVTGEDGKRCVHGQFLAAYHRLHTLQMDAFPPVLTRQRTPTAPVAPEPAKEPIAPEPAKEPPAPEPGPPRRKSVDEALAEALAGLYSDF